MASDEQCEISPAGQGKWWPGAELNCRHCDFQSHALPTELPGRGRADYRELPGVCKKPGCCLISTLLRVGAERGARPGGEDFGVIEHIRRHFIIRRECLTR